jgi:putative ABC transport system permease protein
MTDWISYLRSQLTPLAADPAREAEIVEELAQHLTDIEQEKLASGATPEEAQAAARAEVSNRQALAREILRADRSPRASTDPPIEPPARFLVGFTHEVRYSFRQLTRSPAFAATVIFLLALGIGINAATYSVVRNVLLEPLPFHSPEHLTIVWWVDKNMTKAFQGSAPVSGPNFLDFRRESRSFEHLVATAPRGVNLTGQGEAERLQGTVTTAGLFEMLHTQPSLGRTFRSEEEQPGRNRVAVISDALWRNRFAADPLVLGRSLTLNGEAYIVVGVMPRGFQNPSPWTVGKPTDVWIPLPLDVLQVGRDENRYVVLGRLKPDVGYAAAQAEMTAISERLERAYPDADNPGVALLIPLRQVLVGRLSGRLWMLLGASGLVFLIVCANVAGLFVARAVRRQTEMAIRAGLGASRGRLVRQFAIEHLPVCLLGGTASVAVAVAASRMLRALMPPSIPRIDEIRVDGSILVMTLLLSLVVALIASVVPTLTASRRAFAESLRQGRGPAASGRSTGRRVLVVAQLALTVMLAHSAALMLRSYWTLSSMETGFNTEDVLTMRLDLSGPRYAQPERAGAFFDEAVRRVESLPGVTQAAAINRLPLEGGRNNTVKIEARDPRLGRGPLVETRVITPGYFDAMGIRLVSGRTLAEFDGTPDSLPTAVINQAMARFSWPDVSPIGKRFRFDEAQPWLTVVGVVADTRQSGIESPARPEAYMIHGASPFQSELRYLVVRTATDPPSIVRAVRREIAGIDSNQPVADVRTMADVVDTSIAERRFGTMLVGLFALTALALVVAAIYALMSFFVARRTPEIGVRMAFGATRGAVLRLILSTALTLIALGTAIGLAGIMATTRLARGLVYGISPSDPGTVAGATVFLVVIALAGSLVPAWRASRVDPVEALRAE